MGIMSGLSARTVDVRDMPCGQALAVVSKALARDTAAEEFVVL